MPNTKLQVLRGDHEHCLVLTDFLKRALSETDLHKHSELVQDFLMKWQSDLDEHFKKEESVLLPAYARYASIDDPDFILLFLQHADIRRLVYELAEKNDSGIRADDTIQELIQAMVQHVDHEESVLLPKMESTIPEERLRAVVAQLTKW
ncbi:MAG: hemerythrin domain-containing protein [Bacteroidetes bacterium]|nr:hemerythrin domain-containing protein [Bacteroidota bacterium]